MGGQCIFLFQNEEPQVWTVLLNLVGRGHANNTPADNRYIKKLLVQCCLLERKDSEVIPTSRAKNRSLYCIPSRNNMSTKLGKPFCEAKKYEKYLL